MDFRQDLKFDPGTARLAHAQATVPLGCSVSWMMLATTRFDVTVGLIGVKGCIGDVSYRCQTVFASTCHSQLTEFHLVTVLSSN
ncbi:uncharacterized protein CANTADRAFT_87807 [Suhomyces tanzawaensis NRRL Y-17324]|uniref:Uncharacterized protein n=1 Tax=Suhomyces tanzawaensis NRRL Y-17324 TaxID=984487 RepID=A0A1E4SQS5_9ASCO|nr:uncharacterized protein CANTADRAFT_87807 [Suhomyces tanzawaensis NRRL Y-17324]ODV81851.1 hypothetical protein CANTADRAFT_87807 [Suhomyces tanzawaensis NRRL Y-17324]